jgi:hypothetical protein
VPAPPPSREGREYHLNYEIQMLEETGQTHHDNQVINNAIIESFCAHARNLIEFFKEESQKYTSKSYRPFSHTSAKALKRIYGKLNTQIAHVRYSGRTEEDEGKITELNRREIINLLSQEIKTFKAHLLPHYNQNQSAIRDLPPVTIAVSMPLASNATTDLSCGVVYFSQPPHPLDC